MKEWHVPDGTPVVLIVAGFTKTAPRNGQALEWFWPSSDGAGFLLKWPDTEHPGGADRDDLGTWNHPFVLPVSPAAGTEVRTGSS